MCWVCLFLSQLFPCSCEGQAYVSGSGIFCCVGVWSVDLKSSINWWFECLVPDGGTILSDSRDLASGIKLEEVSNLGTHYYWQHSDLLFGSWLAMEETVLLWHLFLQSWYSAQTCGIKQSCIEPSKLCARIILPSLCLPVLITGWKPYLLKAVPHYVILTAVATQRAPSVTDKGLNPKSQLLDLQMQNSS